MRAVFFAEEQESGKVELPRGNGIESYVEFHEKKLRNKYLKYGF